MIMAGGGGAFARAGGLRLTYHTSKCMFYKAIDCRTNLNEQICSFATFFLSIANFYSDKVYHFSVKENAYQIAERD